MIKTSRLKSMGKRLDFTDVRQELAKDVKVAATALGLLWLMSVAAHIPLVHVLLANVWNIDVADLRVRPWVSWVLFGMTQVLYFTQLALRVNIKPLPEEHTCTLGKPQPMNNEHHGKNFVGVRRTRGHLARVQSTEKLGKV